MNIIGGMQGPKSILIVEDEKIVALDFQNRLEKLGYTVTGCAVSYEETVTLIQNELPDIIIMDIILKSGEDGITLAKKIRQNYDIPVIFSTVRSDESTLKDVVETEGYGYLNKPVNNNELRYTLEIAYYHHQTASRLREKEKELSRMNSLLEGVMNYCPSAIFAKDYSGNYLFANSAFLTNFIRDENTDIKGKNDSRLFSPPVAGLFEKEDQKVLESGEVRESEATIQVHGRTLSYLTTRFPLYDDKNQIIGVCGIATDITETL